MVMHRSKAMHGKFVFRQVEISIVGYCSLAKGDLLLL